MDSLHCEKHYHILPLRVRRQDSSHYLQAAGVSTPTCRLPGRYTYHLLLMLDLPDADLPSWLLVDPHPHVFLALQARLPDSPFGWT